MTRITKLLLITATLIAASFTASSPAPAQQGTASHQRSPAPPTTAKETTATSAAAAMLASSDRSVALHACRATPGALTGAGSGSTVAAAPSSSLAVADHRLHHQLASLLVPLTMAKGTTATPVQAEMLASSDRSVALPASRAIPGELTAAVSGSTVVDAPTSPSAVEDHSRHQIVSSPAPPTMAGETGVTSAPVGTHA
jgi:hypothetical protein